jgi:hypothetical protein
MDEPDLLTLIEGLSRPEEHAEPGERFRATPIPGLEQHRIAVNGRGQPALLLKATDDGLASRRSPVKLEHIMVQHDLMCRLEGGDGQREEATFTVVQFVGSDSALRRYFLRVLSPILASLGTTPTRAQVYQAISGLIQLFEAATEAPRAAVQGLWAELLLIVSAHEPGTVAAAWHVSPDERYDFHAGVQRLEVKSASGRRRQHHFSLAQLEPPEGTQLAVASVLMERAGAGTSLGELIQEAHTVLSHRPDLRLRLDLIVGQTLGEALSRSLETRFDRELAIESIAFFDHAHIPRVPSPLPPEVDDVHFRVDLSTIMTMSLDSGTGQFLSAAAPAAWHRGERSRPETI